MPMLQKLPSLFPWKHNKTKTMADAAVEEVSETISREELVPCAQCGRTFLPGSLAKHVGFCQKNAAKKRKVFCSLKQRVEGTDLAPFHQRSYLKKQDPLTHAPVDLIKSLTPNTWKEKHQEFVNAIRAAKSVETSPLPPKRPAAMSSSTTNFERCPSCERQFGPKAYDRHVEWCMEKRARLPQSPANVQQAKERLEARIKYRVPPVSKTKKTIKEKYQSPHANPKPDSVAIVTAVKSTGNLIRKPSVRRTGGSSTVNLIRKPEKPVEKSPDRMPAKTESRLSKPETIKSSGKRMPALQKLNTTSVNTVNTGITVSQLNSGQEVEPKKLITWTDTVVHLDKDAASAVAQQQEAGSGVEGKAGNLTSWAKQRTETLERQKLLTGELMAGKAKSCNAIEGYRSKDAALMAQTSKSHEGIRGIGPRKSKFIDSNEQDVDKEIITDSEPEDFGKQKKGEVIARMNWTLQAKQHQPPADCLENNLHQYVAVQMHKNCPPKYMQLIPLKDQQFVDNATTLLVPQKKKRLSVSTKSLEIRPTKGCKNRLGSISDTSIFENSRCGLMDHDEVGELKIGTQCSTNVDVESTLVDTDLAVDRNQNKINGFSSIHLELQTNETENFREHAQGNNLETIVSDIITPEKRDVLTKIKTDENIYFDQKCKVEENIFFSTKNQLQNHEASNQVRSKINSKDYEKCDKNSPNTEAQTLACFEDNKELSKYFDALKNVDQQIDAFKNQQDNDFMEKIERPPAFLNTNIEIAFDEKDSETFNDKELSNKENRNDGGTTRLKDNVDFEKRNSEELQQKIICSHQRNRHSGIPRLLKIQQVSSITISENKSSIAQDKVRTKYIEDDISKKLTLEEKPSTSKEVYLDCNEARDNIQNFHESELKINLQKPVINLNEKSSLKHAEIKYNFHNSNTVQTKPCNIVLDETLININSVSNTENTLVNNNTNIQNTLSQNTLLCEENKNNSDKIILKTSSAIDQNDQTICTRNSQLIEVNRIGKNKSLLNRNKSNKNLLKIQQVCSMTIDGETVEENANKPLSTRNPLTIQNVSKITIPATRDEAIDTKVRECLNNLRNFAQNENQKPKQNQHQHRLPNLNSKESFNSIKKHFKKLLNSSNKRIATSAKEISNDKPDLVGSLKPARSFSLTSSDLNSLKLKKPNLLRTISNQTKTNKSNASTSSSELTNPASLQIDLMTTNQLPNEKYKSNATTIDDQTSSSSAIPTMRTSLQMDQITTNQNGKYNTSTSSETLPPSSESDVDEQTCSSSTNPIEDANVCVTTYILNEPIKETNLVETFLLNEEDGLPKENLNHDGDQTLSTMDTKIISKKNVTVSLNKFKENTWMAQVSLHEATTSEDDVEHKAEERQSSKTDELQVSHFQNNENDFGCLHTAQGERGEVCSNQGTSSSSSCTASENSCDRSNTIQDENNTNTHIRFQDNNSSNFKVHQDTLSSQDLPVKIKDSADESISKIQICNSHTINNVAKAIECEEECSNHYQDNEIEKLSCKSNDLSISKPNVISIFPDSSFSRNKLRNLQELHKAEFADVQDNIIKCRQSFTVFDGESGLNSELKNEYREESVSNNEHFKMNNTQQDLINLELIVKSSLLEETKFEENFDHQLLKLVVNPISTTSNDFENEHLSQEVSGREECNVKFQKTATWKCGNSNDGKPLERKQININDLSVKEINENANQESSQLKPGSQLTTKEANGIEVVDNKLTCPLADSLDYIPVHDKATTRDIPLIQDSSSELITTFSTTKLENALKASSSSIGVPTETLKFHEADCIIYEKTDADELESFKGFFSDAYSTALSKARLEREVRSCCSEVTVGPSSFHDLCFVTFSETDLTKFNRLQCCMKDTNEEDLRVLEIAGDQFVAESSCCSRSEVVEEANVYESCLNANIDRIKRLKGLDENAKVEVFASARSKQGSLDTIDSMAVAEHSSFDSMETSRSCESVSPVKHRRAKHVKKFKLPKIQGCGDRKPKIDRKKMETLILPDIRGGVLNKRANEYNTLATAERQLMELLECDDFKPLKSSNKPKPSANETNKTKHKRASVIDPPTDFRDDGDDDIFEDNFELIENFINDNYNNEELLGKLDFDSISLRSIHLTKDGNYNDDEVSIDPRLINEFDNLSIPDTLIADDDCCSPNEILPEIKSIRKKTPEPSYKTKKSSSLNSSDSRHKRSLTVLDPVKPKSVQNKHQHTQQIKSPRKEESSKVDESIAEDLFPIDDEMYEEYKKYEQMYLQEKEKQRLETQKKSTHSEDESLISKISGDSAYGSLSRNKQKVRSKVAKLSPLDSRADSASSSGSETCVMQSANVGKQHPLATPGAHFGGDRGAKVSKFCHECGSKYPVPNAKFCVECGVRRLVL